MRALGTLFVVVACAFFVGAAVAVFGFLGGGIDALDDGEPQALMAYVPVGLALGLVGTFFYMAGTTLRGKKK